MPTVIKHQLFRLIKSLNKAEKRNFKLYAKRAGATAESKFIRLFDAIDKSPEPKDELLLKRVGITAGKLSNLKRHLYQQVLTSLRLIHISKEIDIELREQIDFTRILYGKGHYLDALRLLERAKDIAVKHNQDILHMEILEFQKLIEARHVTLSRQVDNKMDLLLIDLYLRCLYYVSMFGFLNGQVNVVQRHLNLMDKFLKDEKILLNQNTRHLGDVYRNLSCFNLLFMQREFEEAYKLGQGLQRAHKTGGFTPNSHRWALFLYKCAGACFLTKRYDEALDYLNDIINMRNGIFREDLLINTRLLHAICNFELTNYSLVDYHLKSVNRLLSRSRETASTHTLAVSGLRKLLRTPIAEHGEVYEKLRADLAANEDQPFEQKAMLYLNLPYWLNSHLAPAKV